MVQWIKMSDIERIDSFDKQTGEKLISYQIKIRTNAVAIPVGMEKEVMVHHIKQLDEEGRFMIEEWFEEFVFSRLGEKFDYEIQVEDEEVPSIRIVCSDFKKEGSITVIGHRDDVINMVGKGTYKQIIQALNKRIKIDPEKIRLEFGD